MLNLPPIDGRSRSKGGSRGSSRSPTPVEPDRSTSLKGTQLKNQIKAKFHELDVNKDGSLSFEELTVFLGCLSSKLKEKEVYELFRKMDRNRDDLVQFDEFVDFIFASDMDQNPTLRAHVQAAADRQSEHVMTMLDKGSEKERSAAQKSGRERLGQLHGSYSFSWQMDEELESVKLELSEDGRYQCEIISQLGEGMVDRETSTGTWEVSAVEHEVLLYKEGMTRMVQRLGVNDFGDLDLHKEGPLSRQSWLLRRDGYLD
ncbi:Probable calcium-binding protein CML25 (Calmodulin-like protein 25) [Durusdinium trenchii]|uniref:Probable calcium-binding protein CML25 (Calmodulin-like protein 25) n=1 Tax=Durusdinium trenchii TaxID=1381693 RepID=A0ABP0PWH3_9DINO